MEKLTKKLDKKTKKEMLKELENYINFLKPEFDKFPQELQDIIIHAFVMGYTSRNKPSNI